MSAELLACHYLLCHQNLLTCLFGAGLPTYSQSHKAASKRNVLCSFRYRSDSSTTKTLRARTILADIILSQAWQRRRSAWRVACGPRPSVNFTPCGLH